MKILDRPTARMLEVVRRSRKEIALAFRDATDYAVARCATIVLLRGADSFVTHCESPICALGDGWTVCHAPRDILSVAFPECGLDAKRLDLRVPLAVVGDDMGTKKMCVLRLEDLGLCLGSIEYGREARLAAEWTLRAVESRLTTIAKQLSADGALDPTETVIDATVIRSADPDGDVQAEAERDASGVFFAPSEYVVRVTTRSRSDEWMRLASHPEDCPAIKMLQSRCGKEFVLTCRYDGTEVNCRAELPGALA